MKSGASGQQSSFRTLWLVSEEHTEALRAIVAPDQVLSWTALHDDEQLARDLPSYAGIVAGPYFMPFRRSSPGDVQRNGAWHAHRAIMEFLNGDGRMAIFLVPGRQFRLHDVEPDRAPAAADWENNWRSFSQVQTESFLTDPAWGLGLPIRLQQKHTTAAIKAVDERVARWAERHCRCPVTDLDHVSLTAHVTGAHEPLIMYDTGEWVGFYMRNGSSRTRLVVLPFNRPAFEHTDVQLLHELIESLHAEPYAVPLAVFFDAKNGFTNNMVTAPAQPEAPPLVLPARVCALLWAFVSSAPGGSVASETLRRSVQAMQEDPGARPPSVEDLNVQLREYFQKQLAQDPYDALVEAGTVTRVRFMDQFQVRAPEERYQLSSGALPRVASGPSVRLRCSSQQLVVDGRSFSLADAPASWADLQWLGRPRQRGDEGWCRLNKRPDSKRQSDRAHHTALKRLRRVLNRRESGLAERLLETKLPFGVRLRVTPEIDQ